MIEFICPIHDNKGIQSIDWSHFKTYKHGCTYCSGRHKTSQDMSLEINNNTYTIISDYIGFEKQIICKCNICNNIWTTTPASLYQGCACPECGKIKRSKSRTKTQEQFEIDLNKANPFISVIGKYIGAHKKVKCKCKKCDNEWYAIPSNLLNNSASCPRCNLSSGERKMLTILDDMNIKYIPQYSFNDCKNVFPLRFDAFDVENNVGFEYNGEQHYQPINMSSKTYNSKEEFEKTINRDRIKYKYCKDNNIPLIIIPYWEKDNMRNFILEEIKKKGLYC